MTTRETHITSALCGLVYMCSGWYLCCVHKILTVNTLHYTTLGIYIFSCWFYAIKCLRRFNVRACFIYGALIKASFSHPAGTHTQRLWTGVWCYFPGWANCLWGSVLSLSGCSRTSLRYTMQLRVPGKALMKSYEELDASWLWREGWREDTVRWKMGVKPGRVKSEAWEEDGGEERRGGRRHAVRQKDGWKQRKHKRLWGRETQHPWKPLQARSLLLQYTAPLQHVHHTHFTCSVMCLANRRRCLCVVWWKSRYYLTEV